MAVGNRTVEIETAEGRASLEPRRAPYWWWVTQGLFLGFRSNKRGLGSWVLKFWCTERKKYRVSALGFAEGDIAPPLGKQALSFTQALSLVRRPLSHSPSSETSKESSSEYSVGDAANDYITYLTLEEKSSLGTVVASFRRYVFGHPIEHIPLANLRTDDVLAWRKGVWQMPRGGRGAERRGRRAMSEEETRRRKCTSNRVLGQLSAALTRAWREGHCESKTVWARVQKIGGVESSRVYFLRNREEVRRVLDVFEDPNWLALAKAGIFTGARYGDLCSMPADAFDPDAEAVFVPPGKTDRERWIYLAPDGLQFFKGLVVGPKNRFRNRLFLNRDGRPFEHRDVVREMTKAKRILGSEFEGLTFTTMARHTFASHLVMAGVPIAHVAYLLGHSSTKMVQQHYAHLIPEKVAKQAAQKMPHFGIAS